MLILILQEQFKDLATVRSYVHIEATYIEVLQIIFPVPNWLASYLGIVMLDCNSDHTPSCIHFVCFYFIDSTSVHA